MPSPVPALPWSFPRSIRPNAFGWRSSRLAASKLREAFAEIRAVARIDPVLGGEGAVHLLERISPAFAGIDTSTGALGTATKKVVKALFDLICAARPAAGVREQWVRRLEEAIAADGFDWLSEIQGRLGEIAGGEANEATSPAVAPGVSVSRTFLEFLGPMWEGVADQPEALRALLRNGLLVWNAVVMADHGGEPKWLNAIRERIGGRHEGLLIEALVARKRENFDAHHWLVRDCSTFERDGELRLCVEAGNPP
ncbi:MAG: hypothetical protein U1F36_23130 [Planctomycetota bacterium]